MLEEMKTVLQKVSDILEFNLTARDNDMMLIFEVWKREGVEVPYELRSKIYQKCSSPESIRRVRQKLQEEGLFLGKSRDEKIKEESKVRDAMKDGNWKDFFAY